MLRFLIAARSRIELVSKVGRDDIRVRMRRAELWELMEGYHFLEVSVPPASALHA